MLPLFMCRENICFRGQFFLLSAPSKWACFALVFVQEIGLPFLWTIADCQRVSPVSFIWKLMDRLQSRAAAISARSVSVKLSRFILLCPPCRCFSVYHTLFFGPVNGGKTLSTKIFFIRQKARDFSRAVLLWYTFIPSWCSRAQSSRRRF